MVINDLRGMANRGFGRSGHLPIDSKNWGIFLPSNSTLQGYTPPVKVYEGISEENLSWVLEAMKGSKNKLGGIVFDEMEIRKGLTFRNSTREIIGLAEGAVKEKEISSLQKEDIKDRLATHILKAYFVSTDGKVSIPIGFLPMKGMNGKKAYSYLREAIEYLKRAHDPIEIHWGSSDGIISHGELIKSMKKYGNYNHVFDPLHLIKNLRNALLNCELSEDGECWFSIHTLNELRDSSQQEKRTLFRSLLPDCPIPKDQMDVSILKQLLEPQVHQNLEREGKEEKALARFLKQAKNLYDGFTCNQDDPFRIQKLEEALKYFKTIKQLSPALLDQIGISVNSFRHLSSLCNEKKITFKPSIFGTILVEKFFSQVRRKIRFPSLLEYSFYDRRAFMELVKQNCEDSSFQSAKKGVAIGKCYNNVEGNYSAI